MKKNRVAFNILMLLTVIAYAAILILGNVSRAAVPVATVKGSYANEFAKEHKLPEVEMTEIEKALFDLRYETFTYNENEQGVVLEKYDGVSETLVVPKYVDGKEVVALGENFFADSNTVKEVYLPTGVEEILGEPVKSITIYCDDSSDIYKNNDEESGWHVELVNDSTTINHSLDEIPFAYEKLGNEIEIIRYYGDDANVVIPSHINGYEVTAVSMDLLGKFGMVVIPETVTSITGEVAKTLFSLVFAIEFVFTVAAFLIAFVMINVIMGRMKNQKEVLLTGPQYVITYLYVFVQTVFGVLCIYKDVVNSYIALAVSTVLLLGYLFYMITAKTGRSHAVEVQEKRKEATAFMKMIKVSSAHMADAIKDAETKKCVERLVENIKFSDPVSNEKLEDIEKKLEIEIEELKQIILTENSEDIKEKCLSIEKTLKTRNELCKSLK